MPSNIRLYVCAGVTPDRRTACKLWPRNFLLTTVNPPAYSSHIGKTVPIRFGDLAMLADNRRRAVFLRPYTFARPQDLRVGLGGETLGSAGANVPVRQPCSVPAHPFGDGKRAFNTNVGGRIMRRISARSEQKQSAVQYPLFTLAGERAAELWLISAPMSAGEFRDHRYRALMGGMPTLPGDEPRRGAFNEAFARQIATFIVQQSRAEISHV